MIIPGWIADDHRIMPPKLMHDTADGRTLRVESRRRLQEGGIWHWVTSHQRQSGAGQAEVPDPGEQKISASQPCTTSG